MSPMTDRGEWISRDPAELTTHALLADLLGYDDGFAGRGLRSVGVQAAVVALWIKTPRGRELAHRLRVGQLALADLDPDPRYVAPEPEPARPAYAGDLAPARSCLVIVIAGLVIVGILIAQLIAASRPGPNPTAPTPASDVAGLALASTVPAASSSGSGQSGAPHGILGLTRTVPGVRAESGTPPPAGDGLNGRHTPVDVAGPATWYDAPTSHDAAAGPALRRAIGPHWRGATVRVCSSSCVTVALTDWCACGHGRVLDLDDHAFARLAPLSQGIVRVRVTLVGEIDVPSTSRPTAPPTDVR